MAFRFDLNPELCNLHYVIHSALSFTEKVYGSSLTSEGSFIWKSFSILIPGYDWKIGANASIVVSAAFLLFTSLMNSFVTNCHQFSHILKIKDVVDSIHELIFVKKNIIIWVLHPG